MTGEGREGRDLGVGCLLTLLLNLVLFIALADLTRYVGFYQWLYLLPAAVLAAHRSRPKLVQGMLTAGALTLLLNALCFGIPLP